MTPEELQAYMELTVCLNKVVIEDPVVDTEFARYIVERAKIMCDCHALNQELRAQYAKIVEIFDKLSGN